MIAGDRDQLREPSPSKHQALAVAGTDVGVHGESPPPEADEVQTEAADADTAVASETTRPAQTGLAGVAQLRFLTSLNPRLTALERKLAHLERQNSELTCETSELEKSLSDMERSFRDSYQQHATDIDQIRAAIEKLHDDLQCLELQHSEFAQLKEQVPGWNRAAEYVADQDRAQQRQHIKELRTERHIGEVWSTHAPLTARLQFLAAVLGSRHPYHPLLTRGGELAEWLGKGEDPQRDYIRAYAHLFADLLQPTRQPLAPAPRNSVERLAEEVMGDLQGALETKLKALGVRLIEPEVGGPITSACEVVEDMPTAEVPAGHIAQVRRLGLELYGSPHLPAQVLRAVAAQPLARARPAAQPPLATHFPAQTPETLPAQPSASLPSLPHDAPEWFKDLYRLSVEPDLAMLQEALPQLLTAMEALQASEEHRVFAQHIPLFLNLLPPSNRLGDLKLTWELVGPLQAIQDKIKNWLQSDLQVTLIQPAIATDSFDERTMLSTGTRRTAQRRHDRHVASLGRAGARRGDHLITKAEVEIYTMGS